MPHKGYEQTEEHKKRLSESLRAAHLNGIHNGGGFVKGHNINGYLGKHHTDEWKNKQRERMMQNNPMKNKDTVKKRSATLVENGTFANENSNNWRGGRSHYRGANWRKQRKARLEKDNYTCQKCGVKQSDIDRELTVHHIIPYHDGGTNELDNLVTLCMSCHFSVEPRYKAEKQND